MAGKREEIATEHPKKDPIVTAAADNVPRAPGAAEAGTTCGRVVGADIVDLRTASDTTTDCPDRIGRVNGKMVVGTSVGSQDSGKTGWRDTQNGYVAGRNTTWHDSSRCSRNEAGQMTQEGGVMADGQSLVVYAHAVRMKRGEETASSKRKDLAAVNACRQEDPSRPACQRVNADYMRRREW